MKTPLTEGIIDIINKEKPETYEELMDLIEEEAIELWNEHTASQEPYYSPYENHPDYPKC
jgi:hypothetical protein